MKRKEPIEKSTLERMYVVECLPARKIAECIQLPISRVYRSLKFHGIPRRGIGTAGIKEALVKRTEMANPAAKTKCMALRESGEPCDNNAAPGRRYCWAHLDEVRRAG